ncbi:hypothetical protein BC835DRAFT_1261399 [Cytidiella melzeri]|nr:hypothetical protein BC835DRAFT_1261399 [Cytidiella melzeri]
MDSPSTSTAALKEEIARLTGAINRHKNPGPLARRLTPQPGLPRNNVYMNPYYKPPSIPQPTAPQRASSAPKPLTSRQSTQNTRDVVIGGVAFESSGRSLVRKDCTPLLYLAVSKPNPSTTRPPMQSTSFAGSKAAAIVRSSRPFKPRNSRRGRPGNRNMTLANTVRPLGCVPHFRRRRKYVDKPCPRFTTTGACTRGLTCPYTHDPSKIAICWPFLQDTCPHTATTCALSHDPMPERTPLCVHFANAGRCTRSNCPFPHVRVGPREGVCRDFAVLGYCEKGLDCAQQHVRECPDFAEKGICTTKGCKLPHVIRANRTRPKLDAANPFTKVEIAATDATNSESADVESAGRLYAEDAQLGDEFISLTFHESDSEDEEEEEEEGGDDQEQSLEIEGGPSDGSVQDD